MDIIVCIKQVPDTETQIKIDSTGTDVVKDDIKWIMNPYDEFGVEEGLRLKEKFGGSVTVVSVGPKRATEAIRTALAMGADKGILLSDEAFENGDSFSTAKVLAAAIKDLPHDVVFCGQRAVDDDNTTAGSALANYLGIPQVWCGDQNRNGGGRRVRHRYTAHRGCKSPDSSPASLRADHAERIERASIRFPPGDNEGQEETLSRKNPRRTSDWMLPLSAPPAARPAIRKLTPPPTRQAGQIVEGETVEEKSAKLVKLLHDEAKGGLERRKCGTAFTARKTGRRIPDRKKRRRTDTRTKRGTNMAKDICTIAEQRNGELRKITYEIISEARRLADRTGGSVTTILLGGPGIGEKAAGLGAYGADTVLVAEDEALSKYTTDAYCQVIAGLVKEKNPAILILGASSEGKDLSSRLAAAVDAGLAMDCTAFDLDDDQNLVAIRPMYAGKVFAEVGFSPGQRPDGHGSSQCHVCGRAG